MNVRHILVAIFFIYLLAVIAGLVGLPNPSYISIGFNVFFMVCMLFTFLAFVRRPTAYYQGHKRDAEYYRGYEAARQEYALTSNIDKLRAIWEMLDSQREGTESYRRGFFRFIVTHAE